MPPRRSASGSATPSTSIPNTTSLPSRVQSYVPFALPPSPIVQKLRTMWQFAVVCQFLSTFNHAFGLVGSQTEVSCSWLFLLDFRDQMGDSMAFSCTRHVNRGDWLSTVEPDWENDLERSVIVCLLEAADAAPSSLPSPKCFSLRALLIPFHLHPSPRSLSPLNESIRLWREIWMG